MKPLDAHEYSVVKAGVEYTCDNIPSPLRLAKLMERREEFVFWLQPATGELNDQLAIIKINGVYYRINQRLEKAIFRHVRLTRNFNNVEVLENGVRKLRIPQRLLSHKLRTSQRFMVSSCVKLAIA
ncbi:MAG: hypothetical protein CMF24_08720 [Ilumatobacter sp.]|nr:hypothetical protein [Ilumatobacter sp.]|tara:strand:- start:1 stop:378 length:378 start_codon:yes stop_codon:yes gene_type:complete